MAEPYLVKLTREYSDGSEVVVNLKQPENAAEIVQAVEEAQAETVTEVYSESVGTKVELEESEVSGTSDESVVVGEVSSTVE